MLNTAALDFYMVSQAFFLIMGVTYLFLFIILLNVKIRFPNIPISSGNDKFTWWEYNHFNFAIAKNAFTLTCLMSAGRILFGLLVTLPLLDILLSLEKLDWMILKQLTILKGVILRTPQLVFYAILYEIITIIEFWMLVLDVSYPKSSPW